MSTDCNIPIVDLSKLQLDDLSENSWHEVGKDLAKALQVSGFVYISNHGIPEEVVTRLFSDSISFFSLPLSVKNNYRRDFETTFHGYTSVGEERMTLESKIELREMFDASVSDTDECNNYPYPTNEEAFGFETSMKAMMKECQTVTINLLRALAYALELPNKEYFVECHKNVTNPSTNSSFTQLRTLYYPSIEGNMTPDAIRCGPHTDYGTITLLFQDGMKGLQVRSMDATWIPANPIHNCILMNVGDLLHIWSAGKFPSTIHRVVIPEEEIFQKLSRQSIALFVKPDNETEVQPLDPQSVFKHTERVDKKKLPLKIYAADHFRSRTVYHHNIATR